MTPDELTAIEQRAEAATKGPWAWDHSGVWTENPDGLCGPVLDTVNDPDAERGGIGYVGDSYPRGINRPSQSMEFIASCRTDVPALCREVRRLTAENAALRTRPTLEQAIEALENATWYHGESYETARRVVRQLYAEEQPHD